MNLKPEQIESEKIEPNDSVDSESNNLNDFKIQQMESFIKTKEETIENLQSLVFDLEVDCQLCLHKHYIPIYLNIQ